MKEVLPLAHTKTDWQIFNKVAKEVLGQEPTRVLDANHISPDEFSSFVASLDLVNEEPLKNLRNGYWRNKTWNHVSISMVYTLDSDVITELVSITDLQILTVPTRKTYFSMITGTLSEWYMACLRVCVETSTYEAREFMTQCEGILERLGYTEIFSDYHRIPHSDETLILRRK